MKSVKLLVLLVLGIITLTLGAPTPRTLLRGNQEKPNEAKFEGVWFQKCWENQGKLFAQGIYSSGREISSPWQITPDRTDKPVKDGKRPAGKWSYKLDPGAKPSAIDAVYLDKAGRETKLRIKGIYELNGDYMTMCLSIGENPTRPTKFTTTGKAENAHMFILRRKGKSF